jgi:hypothetical protein
MGNSYAISALSDKRAEIAGKILDLERQLRVHRSELVHLDAALRLLDPSIKLSAIRAKAGQPRLRGDLRQIFRL